MLPGIGGARFGYALAIETIVGQSGLETKYPQTFASLHAQFWWKTTDVNFGESQYSRGLLAAAAHIVNDYTALYLNHLNYRYVTHAEA